MKNSDILKILYKNNENYVSGEEIASTFNISRAAISKRIDKLKEKGIVIEAVTNKGYRLVSFPEKIIEENANLGVNDTQKVGNKIIVFDEIDSTNDYSKLIAKDSSDGTVVVANLQTKGKGRRGRSFSSNEGGLYFTIILKPSINLEKVPFLTQISAVSIFKALEFFEVHTKIKWPNDIILNNRKLSGILCEMNCEVDFLLYAICGIGINVDNIEFDSQIDKIATSLKKEGFNINKLELFWKILEYFEYFYSKYLEEDYNEIIQILKDNSYVIGKDIEIISANDTVEAKAVDLDKNGYLVVEYEDGKRESINYGEISIRKK